MKNASPNDVRTPDSRFAAIKRPRFSALQAICAVLVAVVVTAWVAGGRQASKSSDAVSPPQTVSVTMSDEVETSNNVGAHAWITNPLRDACTEWNTENGSYQWLVRELKVRGFSQADVLDFCDRFDEACTTSAS